MSSLFLKLYSTSCNPTPLKRIAHVRGINSLFLHPTRMMQLESAPRTPPEFPSRPPLRRHTHTELPQTPNYPDFGPYPPDEIDDVPPLYPGPEFPCPPTPSPPVPDAPGPPMPSTPSPDIPQRQPPDVFPPTAPEVIPLGPPEIEHPPTTQPDIPTPLMGWCFGRTHMDMIFV